MKIDQPFEMAARRSTSSTMRNCFSVQIGKSLLSTASGLEIACEVSSTRLRQ